MRNESLECAIEPKEDAHAHAVYENLAYSYCIQRNNITEQPHEHQIYLHLRESYRQRNNYRNHRANYLFHRHHLLFILFCCQLELIYLLMCLFLMRKIKCVFMRMSFLV